MGFYKQKDLGKKPLSQNSRWAKNFRLFFIVRFSAENLCIRQTVPFCIFEIIHFRKNPLKAQFSGQVLKSSKILNTIEGESFLTKKCLFRLIFNYLKRILRWFLSTVKNYFIFFCLIRCLNLGFLVRGDFVFEYSSNSHLFRKISEKVYTLAFAL